MKPYEYNEPGTDVLLRISPALSGDARVIIDSGKPSVHVDIDPADVPAAVLALYEAAGLPEPVMLERQGIPQDGSQVRYGDFTVKLSDGGVTVALPGIEPLPVPPRAALSLASYIATYALLAEAEPDPAAVDALAMVLVEGTGAMGIGGARPLARKILLAGYAKQEAVDD